MAQDFKQGDDIVIKLLILDRSGNPVDISGMLHCAVAFYVGINRVANFSDDVVSEIVGYGRAWYQAGGDSNELDCLLRRDVSELIPEGEVVARVEMIMTPDPVFPVGEQEQYTEYEITVGNCELGLLREEIIPSEAVIPTLVTAETSNDGTKILLTFDEDMLIETTGEEFLISVNGSPDLVTHAVIDYTTITLTLDTPVSTGDTVLFNYVSTTPVYSSLGALLATIVDAPVTNNVFTIPTLVSANTSVDGLTIDLVFSEAMDSGIVGTEFIFTTGGSLNAVTHASVATITVTLTMTTPISNGDVLFLGYDSRNPVYSDSGGLLETIIMQPVTNNVP